jgi:hypothetical protein
MRLTILSALLALPSASALAMGVRARTELLAFNDAGTCAVLREVAHGPEGGGSVTFKIMGPRTRIQETLGSDFSDGGPRRPQRVGAGACRAALGRISAALAANGFSGVSTVTEVCQSRTRALALTVSAAKRIEAEQSISALGSAAVSRSGLTVEIQGADLLVTRGGAKRTLAAAAPPAGSRAAISTSGRLVVLFTTVNDDQELWGAYATRSGDLADLARAGER